MANTWSKLTSVDVKLEHCEIDQVIKLGGEPPICIIPKCSKPDNLPQQVSATIKMLYGLKDTFNKFASGTSEEAL